MPIQLEVNGESRETEIDLATPLAVYLREELNLRGTKIGCGNGECGACTVIMGGKAVCACLVPLGRTEGRSIETIESLGDLGGLHPVQQKLVERGAFQCGFCTPGMVMSAVDLVNKNPNASETEIREWLEGNICRCTGYHNIVKAVHAGAKNMGG